ncbi:MAG: alkaline phosphatase D family protein [Moraxellaceae bacterium]
MTQALNRRSFLRLSALGVTAAVVSVGMTGCFSDSDDVNDTTLPPVKGAFSHGVASGDPLSKQVILWTRFVPEQAQAVEVRWQVATDAAFTQVVTDGRANVSAQSDYTLKVDAAGLQPNTQYYYRFRVGDIMSAVGKTKTLPETAVNQVKLAVFSCANYPAGFFHAYAEAAKRNDLDAVLHLGDYIYEYARGGYASADAARLGREVEPAHEILSLMDYRTRYAQYRSDPDLQKLHGKAAFICVWDDHEIANDTWKDGAENHNPATEGSFAARKQAAIQAYVEWMPIRPVIVNGMLELARSFQWGNLLNLSMLDTRVIARSEPLDYAKFNNLATPADQQAFGVAMADPTRTMLGAAQRTWLFNEFKKPAKWHVLGQQVLMGRMYLPAAIATLQMTIGEYAELGALAQLAGRAQAGDPTLTPAQLQFLQANIQRLTPEKLALLQLPSIPYNLDAWDGYEVERRMILAEAIKNSINLVVLAGDTHNAWANQLTLPTGTNPSDLELAAGIELATSSVSSPGFEEYLSLDTPQKVLEAEAGVPQLVKGLRYINMSDRGFMLVTFEAEKVTSEWVFVSTVKEKAYTLLTERGKTMVQAAASSVV